MAKKGRKSQENQGLPAVEPKPVELFEIESLNADALDIEELEARLEMAASIGDLALYCGADCGVNCVGNCPGNCVGNCTSLCGADCSANCQADCAINCGIDLICEVDGCGTMQIP